MVNVKETKKLKTKHQKLKLKGGDQLVFGEVRDMLVSGCFLQEPHHHLHDAIW